jgi:hypothetical protein
MTLRKIEWFKDNQNLAEIYQDVSMKFALANEINGKIKQCHAWVKCRDFIPDVIRGSLTKNNISIYGLKYVPSKHVPVCKNKTMLLITMDGVEPRGFRVKLNQAMLMINRYENMAGKDIGKLMKVSGNKTYKHVWLFSGPKMWTAHPHMMSLLTLLFRIPVQFKNEKYSKMNNSEIYESIIKNNKNASNNRRYISAIKDVVDSVVKYVNMFPVDKEGMSKSYTDNNIQLGRFHNDLGIVSVCCKTSADKKVNDVVNEISKIKEEK